MGAQKKAKIKKEPRVEIELNANVCGLLKKF
jgi:hypothetical protein